MCAVITAITMLSRWNAWKTCKLYDGQQVQFVVENMLDHLCNLPFEMVFFFISLVENHQMPLTRNHFGDSISPIEMAHWFTVKSTPLRSNNVNCISNNESALADRIISNCFRLLTIDAHEEKLANVIVFPN